MFNDPFESFHDVVAQAKEEREQLDRLLTISTPRERALVAGSVLILLALLAWLIFGNVARGVALDTVLAEPGGDTSSIDDGIMRAVVWIERDVAQLIETGMAASVELAPPCGGGGGDCAWTVKYAR